jgi:hypothetical protein
MSGLKRLKKYSLKCLITLLVRLAFVILFLWFSLRELNVNTTYHIEEAVRSFFEFPTKDLYFYNITKSNEVQEWFINVCNSLKEQNLNTINSHMVTFSEPIGKIYFRRTSLKDNTNDATNKVIKYLRIGYSIDKDTIIPDEYIGYDSVLPNSDYAYRKYKEAKEEDLPNKLGAYVYKVTSDKVKYGLNVSTMDHISINNIIFDMMVYEASSNMIVFSRAEITQTPFGDYQVDHNVLSFSNGYYKGAKGIRILFDIIAIVLFIYLLIHEIIKFAKRFPNIRNYKPEPKSFKYANSKTNGSLKRCMKILDIDPIKFKNMKTCEKSLLVIYQSVKVLFIFIFSFIKAIVSYTINFSHILFVIHSVSTICIITMW